MKREGKQVRRLDTFHDSDKCKGRVQIEFIYLAEGFEFWVEGVCIECEAKVRSVVPLEQLILMTPNPQNKPFWKPPLLSKSKKLQKEDLEFLKDLGIKGDGEDEDPKDN
jgi:hypothetical protein